MKLRQFSTLFMVAMGFLFSGFVFQAQADTKDVDSIIKTKLLRIGLNATKIEASPMAGMKQVFTDRGLFYVSNDGKYFVAGRLFDLDNNMTNETELAAASQRLSGLTKYEDSMIVFPAKDEKHVITVFTDTTCTYCKKMHAQMSEYNDLGITVKYLAFPRSGLRGRGYEEIRSVWCSADQQSAMTAAKAGMPVSAEQCQAPIAEHYNLGQAAGVTGTPAIILENGTLIPGYKPPQALLQSLKAI